METQADPDCAAQGQGLAQVEGEASISGSVQLVVVPGKALDEMLCRYLSSRLAFAKHCGH